MQLMILYEFRLAKFKHTYKSNVVINITFRFRITNNGFFLLLDYIERFINNFVS
jgi:hypothetical protein